MSINHRAHNYIRREDGVAAVEFAMIAFGFLLLLFSIVEAGYAMWSINTVNYSVEQGARYSAVNDATANETEDYVRNEMQTFYVDTDTLTFDMVTVSDGGVDFIELEAEFTYEPIVGTFIPLPDGSMTFKTRARHAVGPASG